MKYKAINTGITYEFKFEKKEFKFDLNFLKKGYSRFFIKNTQKRPKTDGKRPFTKIKKF